MKKSEKRDICYDYLSYLWEYADREEMKAIIKIKEMINAEMRRRNEKRKR